MKIKSKSFIDLFKVFILLFFFINVLLLPSVSVRTGLIKWFKISMAEEILFKNSMVLMVTSGIIWICINNISVIKSKIRDFCSNCNSNKITGCTNEIDSKSQVSIPVLLNVILIVFSCILVILFFRQYFTFHPVLHPESYWTFPRIMKKGSLLEVIKQCIPTIFNLNVFEDGAYRPRVMTFMVEYININALPFLNRLFPSWGMRLVFNPISILLSIFASFLLINNSFKSMPVGVKCFLSVFPIYFINVQSHMSIFARTTKYLVIPLILFLLNCFFNNIKKHDNNKRHIIKLIFYAFLIFLSTLYDEQIIACVVYLLFLSVLFSLFEKKIAHSAIIFSGSIILYLLWYFFVGKFLFGIFTPIPISEHTHSYSSFLKILSPHNIYDAVVFYNKFISYNFVVLIPFIIFSLILLLLCKNAKQCHSLTLVFPIMTFILSFFLVCANIFGHPNLLFYPDLIYSIYLAPALYLFYMGSTYFFCHVSSVFPYKRIIMSIAFLSLLIVVLENRNNWQEYYSIHINDRIGSLRPIEKEDFFLLFDDFGLDGYGENFYKIILENNINQNFIHTCWW